jgi:hypothetical protein
MFQLRNDSEGSDPEYSFRIQNKVNLTKFALTLKIAQILQHLTKPSIIELRKTKFRDLDFYIQRGKLKIRIPPQGAGARYPGETQRKPGHGTSVQIP